MARVAQRIAAVAASLVMSYALWVSIMESCWPLVVCLLPFPVVMMGIGFFAN
jgi:hypothetical protein